MAEIETPYRYVESSVGPCWIVESMAVVDEFPDLLASTLAIWLADEAPLLAALTPAERVLAFARRRSALDGERKLRAQDPARTCYGAGA